ncbi:uncharacterized protein THITE_127746 [Thermothielavioides terrestris NRRL 8126]|uniref:Mid2 domain-containing protein n=1 Tax=Thermothielavioides terrestris (strain ATCC 38088 / NRRL 8126) TaxID=578455 RepID=G2QWI9_THETT|nr:uncharacterized protein THITE_127746 [Thermothielavioides terrestris NRRL 8126]AEO64764.1 hypothetical protein THITE_127746 [Thermothielavioides terrestris NRRL 8126]
MAVMSLRSLVAVSALLPAVSAGLGREQPIPPGAVQTPAPNLKDAGAFQLLPRVLTAAPAPRGILQKRDTNTCGYVDGNPRSGYICAAPDAECLYNTQASAVGCCLTTSCNIYTACLDYTDSDRSSTLNMDRTRYCSDSDYPSCAVLKYADPTDSLYGYTIPTCDTVHTTRLFYFDTLDATGRTTAPPTTSSSSSSTTNQPTTSSARPTQGFTSGGDSSGSSNSPQPTAKSSSTPVGPIVGGVVGGVAGLALIGLLVFFLIRHKNKNSPPPPPVNPAMAPAPGYMPPPGGPGAYPSQPPPPDTAAGAPGAFDPRYSMAKPAMAAGVMPASPMTQPGSPPPVYYPQMQQQQGISPSPPPQQGMGMGTPPPQQMQMHTPPPPQNGGYVPYPGPQQQQMQMHQMPPPQFGSVELPTQRGDGQLHELS